MTPVAVIGIGSPFGADRVGWEIVQWLDDHREQSGLDTDSVTFSILDRPGAALLEHLDGAGLAVIVDAMQAGREPGSVMCLDGAELERVPRRVSSHGIGVADAVALARALGRLPRELLVIGVEIGEAADWRAGEDDRQRIAAVVMRAIADLRRPAMAATRSVGDADGEHVAVRGVEDAVRG